VFVKSEASRAAAMAKCMAAPALPDTILPVRKNAEAMEMGDCTHDPGTQDRGRSRSRGQSKGPDWAASCSGQDEEMADFSKSVRGPNQYKCAALFVWLTMCVCTWVCTRSKYSCG
jgi:hypothetical protein